MPPPSAERARVLASHAQALQPDLAGSPEAIRYCEEAIAVARAVGARAEEAKALDLLGACLDDLATPTGRSSCTGRPAASPSRSATPRPWCAPTRPLSHALADAGRDRDALDDARRATSGPASLAWNGPSAATLPTTSPRACWTPGAGRSASGLPRSCSPATAGAPSSCMASRGQLLTRRGDFAAAREQLDRALRLSPPSDRGEAWLGLAELALWEGRHDDAATAIAEGLRWYAEADPEGALPLCQPWYTLLLRLEADRAERAAARRAPEEVAEARRRAAAPGRPT